MFRAIGQSFFAALPAVVTSISMMSELFGLIEAAVVEMIIRILPEVAGKISEPLSKTEKMVIVNSGNGVGGGASKLTGDVTQIVAQLPPVIESLTGIKLEKLLAQVPSLKGAVVPEIKYLKEGEKR